MYAYRIKREMMLCRDQDVILAVILHRLALSTSSHSGFPVKNLGRVEPGSMSMEWKMRNFCVLASYSS